VYNSAEKLTSNDYPYGRLRTTAYFSVEYNRKGMRTVFKRLIKNWQIRTRPKAYVLQCIYLQRKDGL
jgi:hypothetical protein